MYNKIKWSLFFLFISSLVIGQRNVLLIIADDLGSDYCGFYENHQDTVILNNVSTLLNRGVRFRNAWSNPLCSPTRAGILTGRYSFRTGVGNAVGGANSAVLDTSEISIPRLLNQYKPNGISKANIGKWHLHLSNPNSNFKIPNAMGYDRFEGSFTGVLSDYFNWQKITDGSSSTVTNYATTETVDNAVSWLGAIPKEKPFFLWLAFNAPHTPYHLPPVNLHSYKNLSGTADDIAANPQSYFKAMVESMDTEIGRLLAYLKTTNRIDSTDIIFIGDNGDDANVAQVKGGAKGSIYQEGVSVPFIISGPSVVNPGRVSDALVNTHDLFATILELFGFMDWQKQIPVNIPIDSKSILPIIRNSQTDIRPWIFTEVFKNPTVAGDGKAMRNEEYKLLDFDNGNQKFYNLLTDPNENSNLLDRTLSSKDQINYQYLCREMTNLTGLNRFCSISSTESGKQTDMRVFPNPFEKYIHIEGVPQGTFFILSNALGTIYYNGSDVEHQDFSRLLAGTYYLRSMYGCMRVQKM